MDFVRTIFYHKPTDYVNPGAQKEKVHPLYQVPEVDQQPMRTFPPAFFRHLQSSFTFDESFIAQSLVSDTPPNQEVLTKFLAALGLFPNEASLKSQSHVSFLKSLFNGEIADEVIEGVEGVNLNIFSFASPQFELICDFIHKQISLLGSESPIQSLVLLFFTPLGFAKYTSPDIEWTPGKFRVGIVLSQKEILPLDPNSTQLYIRTPQRFTMKMDANRRPEVFCEFKVVAGHWQPFFDSSILSLIPLFLQRNGCSTRDGNTLGLWQFAKYSTRVIGLIGRFSWIVKLFPEIGADLISRGVLTHLNPALFFVQFAPQSGYLDGNSYVILYIPGDFPPNHPQFEEVAQYAYTWMRRACSCALFVPDLEYPKNRQIGNIVHGIVSSTTPITLQFYGSQKTLLMTLQEGVTTNSLVFDDIDDLFAWLDWLWPRYRADFSGLPGERSPEGPPFIALDRITIGEVRSSRPKRQSRPKPDARTGRGTKVERDIRTERGTQAEKDPQTGLGKSTLSELFYGAQRQLSAEEQTAEAFSNPGVGSLPEAIAAAADLTTAAHNANPGNCVVCEDLRELSEEDLDRLRKEKSEAQLCGDCRVKRLESSPKTDTTVHQLENSRKAQVSRTTRDQLDREMRSFITRGGFFVAWFLEYWACYCLEARWDDLRQGNRMRLRNFDSVERTADHKIVKPREAMTALNSRAFASDGEYLNFLAQIATMSPQQLNRETIGGQFRPVLLANNEKMLRNRAAIPRDTVFSKCQEALTEPVDRRNKRIPLVFNSISAVQNQTVCVDIAPNHRFVTYIFHSMIIASDERLSAEPLYGEVIATLSNQPEDLLLVNAWCVPPGALVLTALGGRLRLSLLRNGFRGQYPTTSVYETKIKSTDFTTAAFASLSNTLILTFDGTEGLVIALIEIALDFCKATELRRRPLSALLPLPITGPVTLGGLIVDDSATRGVLSANREGAPRQYVLVDFDPSTLALLPSSRPLVDIPNPIIPLHFLGNDGVITISPHADPHGNHHIYYLSQQARAFAFRLNPFNASIRCKIGVAEAARQPVLIFSREDDGPYLRRGSATIPGDVDPLPQFPPLEDMFSATIDQETIPQFAANCLRRFGLSEIERVSLPTRSCYPVELARLDILTHEVDKSTTISGLVRSLRTAMATVAPLDWSAPVSLHHFDPATVFGKNGSLGGKMGDPIFAVIGFVARLNGMPRVMVDQIPPPLPGLKSLESHIIAAMAARVATQFPPFSLLRATVDRKATILTVVDVGVADGAPIFSGLTGVPFMCATEGSFRLGSNFVPDFENDAKWRTPDGYSINGSAVKNWRNVLAVSIRPSRPHLTATNVIALYVALACSNLVVVCADDPVFLLDVLRSLIIDCFPRLEDEFAHLFFPERWADPSGDLPTLDVSPRIAFVTDLGSAPQIRKRELEDALAGFLAEQPNLFVKSCFTSGSILFVDSGASTFEISKAIAQQQIVPLVDDSWSGFQQTTAEALAKVQNAAGYFAGLLSYVDGIMETGVVENFK
jgi:hypothetical protein